MVYAFIIIIGFIFSYLENFFVVIYLSFSFILAQDASARDKGTPYVLAEGIEPIYGRIEIISPKTQSREHNLAMTNGSMHMEREFHIAMTQESMHALEQRVDNSDRKLSPYSIAKLAELMPYCMLTREGWWITKRVRQMT